VKNFNKIVIKYCCSQKDLIRIQAKVKTNGAHNDDRSDENEEKK